MLKKLNRTVKFVYQQRRAVLFLLSPAVIVGTYVLNVCWRVSIAEYEQFGRSTLLPVSFKQHAYDEPPSESSYGADTYTFVRPDGSTVRVYKQLINGFQHAYGSALADFEIGRTLADYLFRANEYAESYVFCRNTDTEDYSLDTRKDLANNAVGRRIAQTVKQENLHIDDAYARILKDTVEAVDSERVLPHFRDPRVAQLPPESSFGCPGLPAERAKR